MTFGLIKRGIHYNKMIISKTRLDEFKKLYLTKYNIVLSDEKATELATQFLILMEILIYPDRKTSTK